jgi:hypothetical protein
VLVRELPQIGGPEAGIRHGYRVFAPARIDQ